MLEIIPAILPKSFDDLKNHLERIQSIGGFVQIDVVDGEFAGKPSWPFVGDAGQWSALRREELGLPFWEDFDFEIDLMCNDPFGYVKDWVAAGAARIVFHVEAINFDDDQLAFEQLRSEGTVDIGFAISIGTENDVLDELIPYADFIQIMGIDPIGAQKQPFEKRCLEKIQFFRQNYPELSISVDGGMNPETAALVIDAGANRIIAGSFIFDSVDPWEAINELQSLV